MLNYFNNAHTHTGVCFFYCIFCPCLYVSVFFCFWLFGYTAGVIENFETCKAATSILKCFPPLCVWICSPGRMLRHPLLLCGSASWLYCGIHWCCTESTLWLDFEDFSPCPFHVQLLDSFSWSCSRSAIACDYKPLCFYL